MAAGNGLPQPKRTSYACFKGRKDTYPRKKAQQTWQVNPAGHYSLCRFYLREMCIFSPQIFNLWIYFNPRALSSQAFSVVAGNISLLAENVPPFLCTFFIWSRFNTIRFALHFLISFVCFDKYSSLYFWDWFCVLVILSKIHSYTFQDSVAVCLFVCIHW